MKRVMVLIPFTDKLTNETREKNDVLVMTDERIAEVRAVSVNMLLVLGEAEDPEEVPAEPKKKSARKKKAE